MIQPSYLIHNCDVLEGLSRIPSDSIDCIVTSPPYWGLRDYGVDGQIGLEPTLGEFLDRIALIFHECKRVLKPTGNLWVNMGDAYAGSWGAQSRGSEDDSSTLTGGDSMAARLIRKAPKPMDCAGSLKKTPGLRAKSLMGQPWRLAFRLMDDGWILRRDIIWHKPTAMPESCKDRCTTAHEYVFHFVKETKYWYDQEAIAELCTGNANARGSGVNPKASGWDTSSGNGGHGSIHRATVGAVDLGGPNSKFRVSRNPGGATPKARQNESFSAAVRHRVETRNARSVWTIPSEPFSEAHFATFPTALPRRCILAGCPPDGTVLDIFAGSGTTLQVAYELGRNSIGIELNPEYIAMIHKRIQSVTPGFNFEEAS